MLIGHSNIKKRDIVIDIGAGSGVITAALAKRCKLVIAVEPDLETVAKLEKNLQKHHIPYQIGQAIPDDFNNIETKVIIIPRDFLEMELPDAPYKVFANPPFHLSSQIVNKLIDAELPPESFYLILQKQFALKLLNTDRHYTSQLGQRLTRMFTTKIRFPLKSTDFTPPPAVPIVLFEAKRIKLNSETAGQSE